MSINGEEQYRAEAERRLDRSRAGLDCDQVAQAMGRVKDPMLRYLLAQMLDLCTERIEQLETALAEMRQRYPVS
jgi:hypothetical protein